MNDKTSNPQLNAILQALLDNSQLFPEKLLPFFSDIYPEDLGQVKKIWSKVALERRISLLAELEDMMEMDTMHCCDDLAKFALTDDFPEVRIGAISLLSECDDPKLATLFGEMLAKDESELVQLAVAETLGNFVLKGELNEIPGKASERIVKSLILKLNSKPSKELHQELLKSLAYSSLPEIAAMIEAAFMNPDPSWQLTAIISMGRSADDRWEKPVLQMIQSENLDFKIEAVKSAGEIELYSARAMLLQMLDEEEEVDDLDLRLNVIWALSRIGGENVKPALQRLLDNATDNEEVEALEAALDELDFLSELPDLDQ
jgi:HEAT repeat protein